MEFSNTYCQRHERHHTHLLVQGQLVHSLQLEAQMHPCCMVRCRRWHSEMPLKIHTNWTVLVPPALWWCSLCQQSCIHHSSILRLPLPKVLLSHEGQLPEQCRFSDIQHTQPTKSIHHNPSQMR